MLERCKDVNIFIVKCEKRFTRIINTRTIIGNAREKTGSGKKDICLSKAGAF